MSKRRIALLVTSIVLWVGIYLSMIFVVPVFREMFAEFGYTMPALTRGCLWLSGVTKTYWTIFMPVFCGALAGVSVVVARKEKRGYALLFFASAVLAVVLLAIALSVPVSQLGASVTK